jgi:DNA-binding transcriptional ArsR family regulator
MDILDRIVLMDPEDRKALVTSMSEEERAELLKRLDEIR